MPRPKTGAYGYKPVVPPSPPVDRSQRKCEKCSHCKSRKIGGVWDSYCNEGHLFDPNNCPDYHDASQPHYKGLQGNPKMTRG